MIYTNQQALRIVTNSYYAFANGTHVSQKDIDELRNLIIELKNIEAETVKYTKELK